MALFKTYDAFLTHPEFVDLTLRPLVEAEVTEFFNRTNYIGDRLYLSFSDNLYNRWRDAVSRRELFSVEDIAITTPATGGKAWQIQVSWTMLSGVVQVMDIPLMMDIHRVTQSKSEHSLAISEAYSQLDRVIAFVKSSGNQS